jgi:transcriptional regulator GlxA family with amidase domain
LDVFGPLEALGGLSYMIPNLNLTIIAETMEPVPSGKTSFWTNLANSSVSEWVMPTHTFENAPPLDVLIIPGGLGSLPPAPLLNSTIAFVKERYPNLQYLITVCVGAGIAASAGVLDGKHATTNKQAWDRTIALGPKVKWVPQARWVTDGNIWTTSGVSAGIDGFLAFLAEIYGDTTAATVANGME